MSFAIAILSMVCASSLHGQQLSLSETNALCPAGVETQFGQSTKPKDYAKDTYLQQQRQNNQSKVGVGMNREDVLELLGPPDFAGAALLNNAEPLCVWLYPAMPHSDKNRDTKYRSLEVTTSFAHRVIAVQSADLLAIDSEAFTGGKQ